MAFAHQRQCVAGNEKHRRAINVSGQLVGRRRICLEILREQHPSGKVLVDVGCGFGWLARAIASEDLAECIGVDPNGLSLEKAKTHAPQGRVMAGDASQIPLPDSCADIVTVFDVIEHVPPGTEPACLREVRRVLRPEGILLLSTPNDHILANLLDYGWYFKGHRHYSMAKLTDILGAVGFRILKTEIRGGLAALLHRVLIAAIKRMRPGADVAKVPGYGWHDRSYDGEGIDTLFVVATTEEALPEK